MQLEASGGGEKRVDSPWSRLANELVPSAARSSGKAQEGSSVFFRQTVLKHLVWAKHLAGFWGGWG